MNALVNQDATYSHHVLHPTDFYPNNLALPVLFYKQAINVADGSAESIVELLKENDWTNSWTGGIFNFQHYHTKAHEVLVVLQGTCMLELGGADGNIQHVSAGDVIVLPAGVVHKSLNESPDFTVLGAYPTGQDYDMNECSADTLKKAEKKIPKVKLPTKDPIYGESGPLKNMWHLTEDTTLVKEQQF